MSRRKCLRGISLVLLAILFLPCGCKSRADKEKTDNATVVNGHRFVDLQLPSGLLWAETNVGATTTTDNGNYYAWGETETKDDCSQAAYRYGNSFDNMTKYNAADGKTRLDSTDDAANVNWGAGCRMPTGEEFKELADTANCTWTWVKKTVAPGDTVSGYEVKSVRNGNVIFLPAAGARNEKNIVLRGESAVYWTSSLGSDAKGDAVCLSFYFANYSWYNNARYIGASVRAVADGRGKTEEN